jgi:hypothetical protein
MSDTRKRALEYLQKVIGEVPNRFLITNLRGLETRYDDKVILHLAAYKDNWLIDERGKDRLNFSRFEIK